MRRTLQLAVVLVAPPPLKPALLRLFGASVGRHVHIGWLASVSGSSITIGDDARVASLSMIRCGGDVDLGAYSIVSNMVIIYGAAGFKLGRHSYVGPQSLINAEVDIAIGDTSTLGPRAMLYTHGSFLPYTEGYWVKFGGITIGRRVWCAAGVFIHPGVTIGDDVFVNSRSVVKGNIPSGKMVEGFPAIPVGEVSAARRVMTPERRRAAIREMIQQFAETVVERELGAPILERGADSISFALGATRYVVALWSEDGPTPDRGTVIALVSGPGQRPAATTRVMVLDFDSYQTVRTADRIHVALRRFLRLRYGVDFEFRSHDA